MPHINSRGDICHGVGGALASINNVAFAHGGVGGWLNDDEVMYTNGDDNTWRPFAYNHQTGQTRLLLDVPVNQVIAAEGGNHWAAGNPGMYSSTGFSNGIAGAMAVGPDGALAYKPDFHSWGPVVVRELDGSEWTLTATAPAFIQLLGNRRAILSTAGNIDVVGLDQPLSVPGTKGRVQAAFVGGQWWICYWHETQGIVLHPFNSFQGYAILPHGDGWHSIRALSANVIEIAIATHEGEQPGQIWGVVIDVVSGQSNQWSAGVNLDLNQAETLRDVRNINATPVFDKFNHPVLIAPYKDPNGGSNAPAEIVVNQTSQSVNRPYFVAEDSLAGPFVGTLLGVYSENPVPTEALAAATKLRTRLLLGHDATTPWTLPSGLRSYDIPCVELYRVKSETLEQSRARWEASVRKLLSDWPGDCGIIAAFYCAPNDPPNVPWTVQEVIDGLKCVSAIVNVSPRIKLVAPFAFLRANGITGHPELFDALRQLLAATPGIPTFAPISSPAQAPTITISDYDKRVNVGGRATMIATIIGQADTINWLVRPLGTTTWRVDVTNPATDLDHHMLFPLAGQFEIAARVNGPGGTGQTGAQRIVLVSAPVVTPDPVVIPPTPPPDPPVFVPPVLVTPPTPPKPKTSWWKSFRKIFGF